MSDTPLQPDNGEQFYLKAFTRPSPLPPDGFRLGVMEVCHTSCPQGEIYPEHESYFCALVWGICGRFTAYVDGVPFSFQSGEFMLLEPGGTLRVQAEEEVNEAYYLLLDGPQAKKIVQETGFWSGVFPYIRPPMVWLERIAEEMNDLGQQKTMASTGHSLIITAFQDAAHAAPDRLVWDACCFIQQNWNQRGLNVESVLAHMNVSRSTLSPRFRKMTGKTILEYIMDIRYRKVLKMLQTEYDSIATIARKSGFPDASYFSVWFRKRSGVSPRSMKRKVAL
jgi:AraC-like DNA-binding protein